MNKLISIIYISMGVMFFFLGNSYLKMKDRNWADNGVAYTSFVVSILFLIYGVMDFMKSEK